MKIENYSFAVAGAGSIGLRHSNNLKTLGAKNVFVFDPDESRKEKIEQLGFKFTSDFNKLEKNIDFGLICTPPNLHLVYMKKFMAMNTNIFVEKPLCHDYEEALYLLKEIKNYKKKICVGFNWRYHDSMKKIKEILDRKIIGEPLIGIFESGQYLADWRPTTDYRKGYFANKETGGGIVSDGCHEIDLATWFVGDPKNIFAITKKVSDLEINTEDSATLVMETNQGKIIQVHLNAVQKNYARSSKIIGSNGTVSWDFAEGVTLVTKNKKETYKLIPDTNNMYVNEIKKFIENIEIGEKNELNYERGLLIQKIIHSAHISARDGKKIKLS